MRKKTSAAAASVCYCHALRQATRNLTQTYDRYLAPFGMRVTQYSILATLQRLGPRSINQLAGEMVMDRTTLGRNILPLERDGLLRIDAHPDDGRSRALVVTKTGLARLRQARGAWQSAQSSFEKAYGATRAADLRQALQTAAAMDFHGAAASR